MVLPFLEFLVVLFIMTILLSIVLVSFSAARNRARDDLRISGVQNIALALEQYYAVCRNYPPRLHLQDLQPCRTNSNGQQLGAFLSMLPPLPDDEEYRYAAFSLDMPPGIVLHCTHYHLGVRLQNETHPILVERSARNSMSNQLCQNSQAGFNGADSGMYDMYRP
ncbi:MAG: type II secretion system GspH family protein [Candidatus Pacebacteria bacterium]|nr:type II secretion system GspH family protein [Candidatus Paceibacterota bacterium]